MPDDAMIPSKAQISCTGAAHRIEEAREEQDPEHTDRLPVEVYISDPIPWRPERIVNRTGVVHDEVQHVADHTELTMMGRNAKRMPRAQSVRQINAPIEKKIP